MIPPLHKGMNQTLPYGHNLNRVFPWRRMGVVCGPQFRIGEENIVEDVVFGVFFAENTLGYDVEWVQTLKKQRIE
jgi:hypothetical protein